MTITKNFVAGEETLSIRKSKPNIIFSVSLYALMLVGFIIVLVLLILRSIKMQKNLFADFIVTPILLYIVLLFYLFGRRMLVHIRNFFFVFRGDDIIVNGKFLCKRKDITAIRIQKVLGHGGTGESFTIGLVFLQKFYPLIYNISEKSKQEYANELAVFFEAKVEQKESKLFPLFWKH